jgi:hypothetical protein
MEQLVSYNQRRKSKKKECLGCGEKGHYIEYYPLMKARRKKKEEGKKGKQEGLQ